MPFSLHRVFNKAGEQKSWRARAVFVAIPPRLALPPLISWEPSLPAELTEAAKATPTWMAQTTKVGLDFRSGQLSLVRSTVSTPRVGRSSRSSVDEHTTPT